MINAHVRYMITRYRMASTAPTNELGPRHEPAPHFLIAGTAAGGRHRNDRDPAKRGIGKTCTSNVIVEEMIEVGHQVCIVHSIGVWLGLRSSVDGKKPRLPVIILGGDHADAALEVGSGAVIADFVVDEPASVVIDLSRFRKGEQTRFMRDFDERLYHRDRKPLYLVLDEADAFAAAPAEGVRTDAGCDRGSCPARSCAWSGDHLDQPAVGGSEQGCSDTGASAGCIADDIASRSPRRRRVGEAACGR